MRSVWIPRIGPPEVLEIREGPDVHAGSGQVRIRVAAAGVNFADVMARMGLYPDAPKLPCVVGYEVAGTVDEIGAGVTGIAPGDKVIAPTRFHGYADLVAVPAVQVVPLPDGMSFEEGAAIPVNYLTAILMLEVLGNARRGDRVLIHGAAGGVGLAAVQLCRIYETEIIGTASASKHAALKAAGVAHTIDYVAFGVSSLAPSTSRRILPALWQLARMPRFGFVGLMNGNRGVLGFNLGHLWDEMDRLRPYLLKVLDYYRDGRIKPTIAKTFPLTDAGAAHAYLQSRANIGKVLLIP